MRNLFLEKIFEFVVINGLTLGMSECIFTCMTYIRSRRCGHEAL